VPRVLTEAEVRRGLKGLEGWKRAGKFIAKTFEFKTFMAGIRFVNDVAKVAELQEHHPDIHIRYTRIKLSIQTHTMGDVTERDIELARAIEKYLHQNPVTMRE
jgi:4a-hydroxytetrahydrobiopterin dehydratase